jgi:phosphatidylinositol-3-phosphatase
MKQRCAAMALFVFFLCGLASAQVPRAGHVFVVMEENHSYSSVVGNRSMPYLNGLAQKYALATQYYGNTHPSIGNYFMLTTGRIITNNDGYRGLVTSDNIVRRFLTAAVTWKAYAEGLPYAGYTGGDTGGYSKHHNPFAYLQDVVNSSTEKQNLAPFTRFATDLRNGTLPRYSFIIPNRCNNAHDCSLGTADAWLRYKIAPLIASPTFQRDGLLIILFDEGYAGDRAHGGGRVAMVVVGPRVRPGYKSTRYYQHQSTLRLAMQALGLSAPGAGAGAPSMAEFFR